jgi:hypothetical protein
MTVRELKSLLHDIPDDFIVCTTGDLDGAPYELNSIETHTDEDYYDINDEPAKGDIVQL